MNWKGIVSNLVFILQVLIIFLLIFESGVYIPAFLQPLGRMHPLILHFPIVLVVLLLVFSFLRKFIDPKSFDVVNDLLLYGTALTTSLTALFGFFLSMEEGYSSDLVSLHKWTGVALSFIVYGMVLSTQKVIIYRTLAYMGVACVIATGHLGASVTHGENFLLEPILAEKITIDENTPVYTSSIQPILDSKCTSCHNPTKKKGKLDLSTWDQMILGGESGPAWISGNIEESEIIKRALLPQDHDDHMPPDGKPQLNEFEIALLSSWISSGPDQMKSLASYDESDSVHILVSAKLKEQLERESRKVYTFKAADPDLVQELNNPFRTVKQSTVRSPALEASIYVREAYSNDHLVELSRVSNQITHLNLSYMPVSDDDLSLISGFRNLEKLILNYTDVSSIGLDNLTALKNLEVLALAGTNVDANISAFLEQMPGLRTVYLWNSQITDEEIDELQKSFSSIFLDPGYIPDKDETLVISQPQLANKSNILGREDKIEFTHSIPDTDIYYTLDGTEPDSTSTKYEGPFYPETITTVRAKAYKKGWQPSPITEFSFFRKGFSPQDVALLKPANQKYKGHGAKTLTDNIKGNIEAFTTPSWLGYQDNNFDALIDFGSSPPTVDHVVMSYGLNILSYIMKPVRVELYGGNDRGDLKLLKRQNIEPSTDYDPIDEAGIDIETGSTDYRYYRLVAVPLKVLPEWHVGAGDKGWVFVDELFFY